jgi:hypothetical protein
LGLRADVPTVHRVLRVPRYALYALGTDANIETAASIAKTADCTIKTGFHEILSILS